MEGSLQEQRLKVNVGKTKVMVGTGIAKDPSSMRTVGLCNIFGMIVYVYSFLIFYGKWSNDGCAREQG